MKALFLKVVVQGRHQEDATALAVLLLGELKVAHLEEYAEVFDQKDSGQNGNQELFANRKGKYGDNSAYRKAARIAHEYLSWVGVVPEKSNGGTQEGRGNTADWLRDA